MDLLFLQGWRLLCWNSPTLVVGKSMTLQISYPDFLQPRLSSSKGSSSQKPMWLPATSAASTNSSNYKKKGSTFFIFKWLVATPRRPFKNLARATWIAIFSKCTYLEIRNLYYSSIWRILKVCSANWKTILIVSIDYCNNCIYSVRLPSL